MRAFLGEFRQRLLDAGKTFVEILLLDFEHSDVESGRGRDLRDARAHQSATENANFLDFHTESFNSPQRHGVTEEIRVSEFLCDSVPLW